MKESAFLINTARGAIVDEPALIRALEAKKLLALAWIRWSRSPLTGTILCWTWKTFWWILTSAAQPRRRPPGPLWPAPRPSMTTSLAAPLNLSSLSCGIWCDIPLPQGRHSSECRPFGSYLTECAATRVNMGWKWPGELIQLSAARWAAFIKALRTGSCAARWPAGLVNEPDHLLNIAFPIVLNYVMIRK